MATNKQVCDLLAIHVDKLHVHRVDGCEDGRGALDDTLARLGHGDWRARGQEDGLVARAERQEAGEVAFHQDHFLVAEAHLATSVARDVHATKVHARVGHDAQRARSAHQLALNGLVVLLLDDVVHAVSVYQQVFL